MNALRCETDLLPVPGTANLHSIPQNCKKCSAAANPLVCDRFAVTFPTSANSDRNIHCYFALDMTFFLEVKFCRRPDVDLQKQRVINTRTLTSNPENKSVHFFQAVLPRNRQHWILLCGFAVNFSFFTTNLQIFAEVPTSAYYYIVIFVIVKAITILMSIPILTLFSSPQLLEKAIDICNVVCEIITCL